MDPKWTVLSCGSSRIRKMYFLRVIAILFLTPLICKGSDESGCDVIPKDVFIERGSSVQIVCLTSCTQEGVRWKQDNRPDKGHESKRINSSHTVLTLRNFTDRMATLECRRLKTDIVIGGTFIRTYTKPSKLSCMLYYEDDKDEIMATPKLFKCKWEDQTDFPRIINYTVICTSSTCTPPYEVCRSQETSCTTNYSDIMGNMTFFGRHNITVRAKSDYGEVFSDQYEFESLKILKIPPPRILSLTAHSRHMLFKWGIQYRATPYQYNCQVRHQKAIGKGTGEWVLQVNALKEGLAEGSVTVDSMDSCSNYTFAVCCALAGGPWSKWSQEKTFLTPLNKSDYKPRLWRTLIGRERVRKVRAVWTDAPSACKDALTYTVKHAPYHERGARAGVLCQNSICEISPSAHTITLTVLRNETVFVEESVYVPAVGEKSLPQITDIQTTTLNGSILVSWRAPLQPVDGYVIDYTHNGDQFTCVETKHTSVTLSGLRDKTPYDITVTALFEDKTGLGARVWQICSRQGAPGAVNISSDEAEARRVLLRWTVEPQEVCGGAVVTYLIVYHSENDGSPLNITVDGKHQEVPLKNLTPGTSYSVFVEARALNGSTRSKDLTFSTKRYDSQLTKVIAVCGGVLIILVLVVGLCCVFQWKKFKDKPVPDPAHSSVATWLSECDQKISSLLFLLTSCPPPLNLSIHLLICSLPLYMSKPSQCGLSGFLTRTVLPGNTHPGHSQRNCKRPHIRFLV
ncbi:interleukin-6 receptor subunit beta-like isoform X2 [Nelusetta ayraudi]|uniref:interleukin-6 receptor subunit beta-like isoform X2 n=1 Tax=Nelusetta ayraudi TaxID=303726 RepID=UPI003F70739C